MKIPIAFLCLLSLLSIGTRADATPLPTGSESGLGKNFHDPGVDFDLEVREPVGQGRVPNPPQRTPSAFQILAERKEKLHWDRAVGFYNSADKLQDQPYSPAGLKTFMHLRENALFHHGIASYWKHMGAEVAGGSDKVREAYMKPVQLEIVEHIAHAHGHAEAALACLAIARFADKKRDLHQTKVALDLAAQHQAEADRLKALADKKSMGGPQGQW